MSTSRFTGVAALVGSFIALCALAACTHPVASPDLGASLSVSSSTLPAVAATTGLHGCQDFAADDGSRQGWRGISFQCLADGSSIRGNQLRGKATVVVVWASWCGPCREELPLFAKFAKQQEATRVIGIGWRDDPSALQAFARETSLPFPSVVDRTSAISLAWNVHAQPTVVFLSAAGDVTHVERARIASLQQLRDLAHRYAG